VKDDLGLKVYISQTGCSIETRIKEHQRHTCLGHPDKSTVAEHSIILSHSIKFQNNTILSNKSRYMDRMIREATEIELHPNNMNRKDGLHLSRSWKPLIRSLKGHRKPPIQQCLSRPGH
jgi:hypothetical protein